MHHFTLEEIAEKEGYASTTGLGRALRRRIPEPILNWKQIRCRLALTLYNQGKTPAEIAAELGFNSTKKAADAVSHRRGYEKREAKHVTV